MSNALVRFIKRRQAAAERLAAEKKLVYRGVEYKK